MKLTAIFAALLLCLALAGCGGGEEASQSPASGGESRSTAPAPEAEDPVGQAEAPEETPESPSSGSPSYGEGGSDPLEFSPYCQMTLEEAAADLEAKGRTVTISQ